VFNGTGFNLANAGKQSTTGFEIDATYDVTDNFTLTFAGTFLDPIYDEFIRGNGINGQEDLSGRTPSGIHEVSTATSATYTVDLANGNPLFIRADWLYEDDGL